MSKRKGETVGHITCPFCLSKDAEVRRTPGKNYFYIGCVANGCAVTQNRGQAYQDYIADNMRSILEGEHTTDPEATEAPTPATLPEAAPPQIPEVTPDAVTDNGFMWPWDTESEGGNRG